MNFHFKLPKLRIPFIIKLQKRPPMRFRVRYEGKNRQKEYFSKTVYRKSRAEANELKVKLEKYGFKVHVSLVKPN